MNRVVYFYISDNGVGGIYITTLKSAKIKYDFFYQSFKFYTDDTFIGWLKSIGAVNAKTVFITLHSDVAISLLYKFFSDEMTFVGLTVDNDNCIDIVDYYDILANRGQVAILSDMNLVTMSLAMALSREEEHLGKSELNKAFMVKNLFDRILSYNVIDGIVSIELEQKENVE